MREKKTTDAKRRAAPGGMRITSWVLLLSAVVLVSVALDLLGLPAWTVWPFVLVLVYVLIFREMRSSYGLGIDDGVSVRCARCDQQPRTETGFCVACSGVLEASPLPASHPAHAVIHALERGDFKAAAPRLARKITQHLANGHSSTFSRRIWLLNVRSGQWAYPDRTGTHPRPPSRPLQRRPHLGPYP